MLKKGSKLYSILTGSCPNCHQENMYQDANPYHLSKIADMNERCGHCNTQYKIEPSFFYGAMFVSYGVGVAIGIIVFIISYVFLKAELSTSFIAIIISQIVFLPIIFRISRNIWINLFIHFKEDKYTS